MRRTDFTASLVFCKSWLDVGLQVSTLCAFLFCYEFIYFECFLSSNLILTVTLDRLGIVYFNEINTNYKCLLMTQHIDTPI